jgi:small GTP-binding protein
MDYDCKFKVLFIGDSTVGKSSLILRFSDNVFHDVESTVGVDSKSRILVTNGRRMKFVMFDTSGQELFKAFTNAFYRGSDAIILMYDMTNRKSFLELGRQLDKSNLNINCLLEIKKIHFV